MPLSIAKRVLILTHTIILIHNIPPEKARGGGMPGRKTTPRPTIVCSAEWGIATPGVVEKHRAGLGTVSRGTASQGTEHSGWLQRWGSKGGTGGS